MSLAGDVAPLLDALPSFVPALVVREIGYWLRRQLSRAAFRARCDSLTRSLRFPTRWPPRPWEVDPRCTVEQFTLTYPFLFPGSILWFQVRDPQKKVLTLLVLYEFPGSFPSVEFTPPNRWAGLEGAEHALTDWLTEDLL